MAEVASTFVSLAPSARGFGSKLDRQIGGQVTSVGKRAGLGLGRAMFGAAATVAAAVGVGHLFSDALGEARESQKVGARTINVIRTTGGVAKVSAKYVGKLATAISNKVGIDDEAIQSGENLLLTFKNIRNEVGQGNKIFDRATKAAVDLSAAGFGDLSGASKQLGKALNDPVKGIAALARAGVTFTAKQKEQIKTLVESGHILKAQKIILREVESQVGGAAEATATAGDKAKVSLANLKEALGTALLPVVDKISNLFTTKLAPALTSFVGSIGPASKAVHDFFTEGAGAPALAASMTVIREASDGMKAGFGSAAKSLSRIKRDANGIDLSRIDAKQLGKVLSATLIEGIKGLGKFTDKLLDFFKGVDWVGLGIKVGTFALPFVLGLATGIINGVGDPALWKGIWAHLPDILFAALAIAFLPSKVIGPIGRILTKIPFVGRFLAAALKWVNDLGGPLRKFAGDLFATFTKAFKGELPFAGLTGRVLAGLRGMASRVGNFFGLLGTRIGVWALDAFAAMGRGAGRAVNALVRLVTFIPRKIIAALGDTGSMLYEAGRAVIGGMLRGIGDAAKGIGGYVKEHVTDVIPGSVRKLLKINSPSKVMMPLGSGVVEGLISGIQGQRSSLENSLHDVTSRLPASVAFDRSHIAAASAGGLHGTRMRLVLANGREFDAYVEELADSRVGAAAGISGMTERAFGS